MMYTCACVYVCMCLRKPNAFKKLYKRCVVFPRICSLLTDPLKDKNAPHLKRIQIFHCVSFNTIQIQGQKEKCLSHRMPQIDGTKHCSIQRLILDEIVLLSHETLILWRILFLIIVNFCTSISLQTTTR